jgi:DNA-binding response OmpR family regulator
MRVLVAEDKPRMARLLQRTLQNEGYSVALAFNGEEALSIGISGGLDVIVLDVMLPGRDGFDVIRNLRAAKSMVPTIMVTARDAMSDIVRGLDSGADDYLTKPFALDVLLARIRALSRRGPAAYPADLQFQDLVLKTRTHEMQRGDRVLPLTRTEYGILEVMIRRAGCVVPRGVLVEAGWGGGAEVSDNTLYVFIRSLRNKIGCEPQLLHTVRGVGYSLRAEPA